MEARSRVPVGLGAVLVGLVWVGVFLRFAGPLPSGFPPSFGGYPFLGQGTPFCNSADLRVFLLAICVYPWCLPCRVLGFGCVWALGLGWLLVFGFGLGWSLAVTTDTLNLFLLQSTGDCHASVDASPLTWEGPFCPLASVPGLGF